MSRTNWSKINVNSEHVQQVTGKYDKSLKGKELEKAIKEATKTVKNEVKFDFLAPVTDQQTIIDHITSLDAIGLEMSAIIASLTNMYKAKTTYKASTILHKLNDKGQLKYNDLSVPQDITTAWIFEPLPDGRTSNPFTSAMNKAQEAVLLATGKVDNFETLVSSGAVDKSVLAGVIAAAKQELTTAMQDFTDLKIKADKFKASLKK